MIQATAKDTLEQILHGVMRTDVQLTRPMLDVSAGAPGAEWDTGLLRLDRLLPGKPIRREQQNKRANP